MKLPIDIIEITPAGVIGRKRGGLSEVKLAPARNVYFIDEHSQAIPEIL
jgi:hypothetical protein